MCPDIKQFIKTALLPVGHTMYVYGGGWNEEDTGAGESAVSIGESPLWRKFFETQSCRYNHKSFLHCSSLGLDCTGYIGWVLYNLFNNENGKDGFVFTSDCLGFKLAEAELGFVTDEKNVSEHLCGDIFFSPLHRHAYISLGECFDKSVLLLHSSPPGVMMSGTPAPFSAGLSLAQKCARDFMRKNYPQWFLKFPEVNRGRDYLSSYHRFRFYKSVLSDSENISLLPPEKVLIIVQ